jgi:N-acetylmuramoyl-L-alanine amidase
MRIVTGHIREWLRQHRVPAAAAAVVVIGALALWIGGAMTAARTMQPGDAEIGEARQAQLTVGVPQAVATRLYGAPEARGRPIVVIDAGHGGRDPGATSVSGQVTEKELTLALALSLRDALVKRGRVRVALTREDDRYLGLDERAELARRLGAGLFVSLHTDSAPNPLARGATVYSLSDVASDAEAARLASSENSATLAVDSGGSGVSTLLADLALRSQMNASAALATRLVAKAAGNVELRPDPHRFASFHVLRRAGTPAVLVEAGYISNADDELLLRSPEHRQALVLALAQAIEAEIAADAVK